MSDVNHVEITAEGMRIVSGERTLLLTYEYGQPCAYITDTNGGYRSVIVTEGWCEHKGGIIPPDVKAHRDDYVSHDYARKLLALVIGTDVDNVEYNNGSYYACARSRGGAITHKYEIT
ncbi:hypothetical protein [Paenibacillus sp. FSL K6-2859]|uniref:hypothetical protein n=1 Tax=Paenibacillus sp. FSL K6-2859 TaxID=2921482 RepID=UPI0030FB1D98